MREEQVSVLGNRRESNKWYQGALDVAGRLAAFGPLFASDPAIQLCLQSARRNLSDPNAARDWYAHFCRDHTDGPYAAAAAAEMWLVNRNGPPPKPIAYCPVLTKRPFLDGVLSDECWENIQPLTLRDAVGETAAAYSTEAWLAYDDDYLYLALRCRHPEGHSLPPVKVRGRDADLKAYDRVSFLLDLDRDYATYYRFQVDQRGCLSEDCWGDLSWNPRWLVGFQSDSTSWRVEAAIPLSELTAEKIRPGQTWACNIVRVLPGRGVQAWSLPADVEPRPEGMGLLTWGRESSGSKRPDKVEKTKPAPKKKGKIVREESEPEPAGSVGK
jgi:hypothetical protein